MAILFVPVNLLLKEFTFVLQSMAKVGLCPKVMEVRLNNIKLLSLKGENVITVGKKGRCWCVGCCFHCSTFPPWRGFGLAGLHC